MNEFSWLQKQFLDKIIRFQKDSYYSRFMDHVKMGTGVTACQFHSKMVEMVREAKIGTWPLHFMDFVNLWKAVDNVLGSWVRWRISKELLLTLRRLTDAHGARILYSEEGLWYIFDVPVEVVGEQNTVELIGSKTRAVLIHQSLESIYGRETALKEPEIEKGDLGRMVMPQHIAESFSKAVKRDNIRIGHIRHKRRSEWDILAPKVKEVWESQPKGYKVPIHNPQDMEQTKPKHYDPDDRESVQEAIEDLIGDKYKQLPIEEREMVYKGMVKVIKEVQGDG